MDLKTDDGLVAGAGRRSRFQRFIHLIRGKA